MHSRMAEISEDWRRLGSTGAVRNARLDKAAKTAFGLQSQRNESRHLIRAAEPLDSGPFSSLDLIMPAPLDFLPWFDLSVSSFLVREKRPFCFWFWSSRTRLNSISFVSNSVRVKTVDPAGNSKLSEGQGIIYGLLWRVYDIGEVEVLRSSV